MGVGVCGCEASVVDEGVIFICLLHLPSHTPLYSSLIHIHTLNETTRGSKRI